MLLQSGIEAFSGGGVVRDKRLKVILVTLNILTDSAFIFNDN